MKKPIPFSEKIADNIRKILASKEIKQATAASYMDVSPSQFSRMLQGKVSISIDQLAKFATEVNMREIDIITWPERYIKESNNNEEKEPVEAILQIRLQSDKKDQVLKLIFGDNDIEILNK